MIDRLSSLLTHDPPGHEAQNLLSLGNRIPPSEDELKELKAKRAGVMVLLFQKRSNWHTLLIRRPSYPGVHSDQIAFPGGKSEPQDPDLLRTAERETEEEVGLNPALIKHLGPLSPLYIPPSNFMVHPFVGVLDGPQKWMPQEDEVAEVIEMPVERIIGSKNVDYYKVETRYGRMKVPAFEFQGHVIWGATGMMLAELGVALEQAGIHDSKL